MKSSQKVVLAIDTTESSVTKVGIIRGENKKEYQSKITVHASQNVLPLLTQALKKESLSLSDISAIEVNTGPGSFTGVRVGVSIANTLGWALHIPVNGKTTAVPHYQSSKFD